MRLAGRTALVLGGGHGDPDCSVVGIGFATATTFARHGAAVVVVDRDADAAEPHGRRGAQGRWAWSIRSRARTNREGQGCRVTLRDATGKVLADLIVGNAVDKHAGQFYVRQPNSRRVDSAKIEGSVISTSFADWVETDLLKVDSSKVRSIVFDEIRLDRQRASLDRGEKLVDLLKVPVLSLFHYKKYSYY